MLLILGAVLLSFGLKESIGADSWNYAEFDNWPGLCTTGTKQSPINIQINSNILIRRGNVAMTDLALYNGVQMSNDGHTVVLKFPRTSARLYAPFLKGKYVLDNIHFHWSSEHTITRYNTFNRYPMEIHLVFYDATSYSLQKALQQENRVVVLGVVVKEGPICYRNTFDAVIKQIKNVRTYNNNQPITINQVNIDNFVPPGMNAVYSGSLTTPNCTEGVQWIVKTEPLLLCDDQIRGIQSIYGEDGNLVTKNNRPTQPLNGRRVEFWL